MQEASEPLLSDSSRAADTPQAAPSHSRTMWHSPSPRRASPRGVSPLPPRDDSVAATNGRAGPVLCAFHFTNDGAPALGGEREEQAQALFRLCAIQCL